MLANKIPAALTALMLAGTVLISLCGCTPPGPRALQKGDEFLRQGQPQRAIAELKQATELLPAEPRAWNLLGLAYHQAGQASLAALAYRQALDRDRSNLVTVAHYNLGCLLLEQNLPAEAAQSLRSYTLITNNTVGWNKLGSARLRLRQFADAEKAFDSARRIEAANAEALNGIGVARAARGQRDAAQYFAAALQTDPNYSPALLNTALLAQQAAATRPAALQNFRKYLATAPRGPHTDFVQATIRRLEVEIAPPANPPATTVAVIAKTNPPTATPPVVAALPTNRPAPVVVVKTNPPSIAVQTNAIVAAPRTNAVVAVTNKPPVNPTPPPVTVVAVSNTPPPAVPAPMANREAPAVRPSAPIAVPPPAPIATAPPALPQDEPAPTAPAKKPGFMARLNPFSGRSKDAKTNAGPRTIIINPSATPGADAFAMPKPSFPRYQYAFPAAPAAGNRADGERAVQQGLTAQRAGRTNEAMAAYAAAAQFDPSNFEARHNGALLALQSGDTARALSAWEVALALQPESILARYSFALALKQAGYAPDAARELERVLEAKPDDARSHLALGNLYAQQLMETAKARAHYQKLLELEPRNPQANAIRFWLAANP